MSVVAPAVSADGWTVFGVDPSSLLFNRVLAVEPADNAALRYWLSHVYIAGEPSLGATFPAIMQAGIPSVVFRDTIEASWGAEEFLFDGMTDHEYRNVFHEILTPPGGILRGCLAANGRWIAAVELFRMDACAPFLSSDMSFVRLVAPAMGRVLNAAFDYEYALNAAVDTPNGPGVIVLGPEGAVQFATTGAESLIALLGEGVWSLGLPVAIQSAVGRMRAEPSARFERVVLCQTAAGCIRVEASAGVEDGTVAVVMTPELPARMPQIPTVWPLTAREREVVGLLIRGMTNRQIASSLVLSENTVESHLAHAYEKLGVHNRGEVLARFFQEVYLEGILPTSLT
ncbi:MAG: helix-turn-helix transcriptional regulator [Chloroflexia bacterium]